MYEDSYREAIRLLDAEREISQGLRSEISDMRGERDGLVNELREINAENASLRAVGASLTRK